MASFAPSESCAVTNDPRQFDPLESAMLELSAAEGTRVFDKTRLDADALLHAEERGHVFRLWSAQRWAAVAAGIVLAFGVWGTMFAYKIHDLRGARPALGVVDRTGNADCLDCNFFGCFTGPTERIAVKCLNHDYDADGDVDLADFRQLQMGRGNG